MGVVGFVIIFRVLLCAVRGVLVFIHVLIGLFLTAVFLPWVPTQIGKKIIEVWSWVLVWLCGVRVNLHGHLIKDQSVMLVCNHVSWLDIFVLNACRMNSFVAKQEIRDWPVLGWLVANTGAVFIERNNREVVPRINQKVSELLSGNACVGLFPEGTTSDGLDLLNFHSALFEGALRVQVPIQPVALAYRYQGKRSGLIAFIGEQTLLGNMWVLFSHWGHSIDAYFLEPVTQRGQEVSKDRYTLAEELKAVIRSKVVQE